MKVNNFFIQVYEQINKERSLKFEKIAFFAFVFIIILLSFFHEPWFDEFQSWGISKDSLYNILFVIPHYEGHPPLWHLIIKCFSVFNIHPELCLKIPNTIFITLSAYLIIFKSPFAKIVRLSLPFTFFILYQYGIICRPYSLFLLFLILCAIFFDTRKTNPYRYICLLALFSLSSAYALIISAGIVIAWGFELIDFKNLKQSFKELFKNKQFFALLLLFFFSALLCIIIYPSEQNTANSILLFLPIWQKALYCLFGIISDATISNLVIEHSSFHNLLENCAKTFYFYLVILFGLFINIFFIKILKKTNLLLFFLIPYLLLIFVFFFKYYSPHHSGLVLFFILFCFWISYNKIFSVISKKELLVLKILTAMIIIIQLFWSIVSCMGDLIFNYECSREIANYIKQHKLYNYKIFAEFKYPHYYIDKNGCPIFNNYLIIDIDKKNDKNYTKKINEIQNMYLAIVLIPYFNKNIFYNFNIDSPDKFYTLHKKDNEILQKELFRKWQKKGLPDVIIGDIILLNLIWKNTNIQDDYIQVKTFNTNYIWKNIILLNNKTIPVYINKNLYEKLKNNYSKPEQLFNDFLH